MLISVPLKLLSDLNRLFEWLRLSVPRAACDDVTWENVRFMLNYLWEKLTAQFWIKWAQWTKLWEEYGGWWVLIPLALIIIFIRVRHHYLAPDVEELTEKANVKGLIKALKFQRDKSVIKDNPDEVYKDSRAVRTRCAAAASLGNLGDERVVEPLLEALCDPDKYVRANVVRALSNFGKKEVKAAVWQSAHKDPDEFVRFIAMEIVEAKGWRPKGR